MSYQAGDKVVCVRGGRGHKRVVKGEVYTVKDYLAGNAQLLELEEVAGKLWYANRFERLS